ncbi:glycosyltransferase [Clostridium sp. D43t1_170807_H7]|uniref:glycosyltransferase family 2 protein n=1 Tax=Clostridium sp. D43t1_170807_H7 TaxID=2787140 RepID=UPI001897B840|nr:glycosyltransferase [Clostridium sp. D43t1_170807_H7]
MNNNPKVSIIMGIYNCENTIRESIESIINQTYKNWELIMCDDCSSDNTYAIANEYRKQYPQKIKLIKNEKNITLAPTLNNCLKIATGKYIARQDGDDISIQDRLEKQVEFLEKNSTYDLVSTQMISFDKNGIKGVRGITVEEPTKLIMINGTAFCHATILTKKSVYDKLNGYNVKGYTKRCEDIDLWFRFFENEFKGYNLKEALYMVRDDDSSYKRRTMKNYINIFLTSIIGYRRVKIPIKYYGYLIKPLITILIPNCILKIYHNKKHNVK